jgi:DNA-binding response OmpR family regulator
VREIVRCPKCGSPLPSGWSAPQFQSLSQSASALRPEVLRVSDLFLNPTTHDASRAGKEIALSRNEFRLLEALMRCSGRVVSRSALIHLVWNSGPYVSDNLIDVTIYHLRKKVDGYHKAKLIRTVRKLGYAIRDPATSADPGLEGLSRWPCPFLSRNASR